jgi:hypothetical protein
MSIKYHQIIENSQYDNFGNYTIESKYQVFYKTRNLYFCGNDYVGRNDRRIKIYLSKDNKKFNGFFTYIKNEEKDKDDEYIYYFDKNNDCDLYNTIFRIFNIPFERIDTGNESTNICVLS